MGIERLERHTRLGQEASSPAIPLHGTESRAIGEPSPRREAFHGGEGRAVGELEGPVEQEERAAVDADVARVGGLFDGVGDDRGDGRAHVGRGFARAHEGTELAAEILIARAEEGHGLRRWGSRRGRRESRD